MTDAPQIRIDLNLPEPAVRQIAEQIRARIVDGALAPGTALPAVRRLSLELGVHFNTVAEAYRLLSAEGWIEVAHGKLARVAERVAPVLSADDEAGLLQGLRRKIAELRARGVGTEAIRREFSKALEE